MSDDTNTLRRLYRSSLCLLTDLYELTMAYGYWKSGMQDWEAAFNLFFRKSPFGGGFAIACGLQTVADLIEDWRFSDSDLAFLAGLRGNDGEPLFEPGFISYLRDLRFTGDVDAVPEGVAVFPHEPLLRVRGPLIPCQVLESALLNIVNFQTLIATKAARVLLATRGEPILEFGLRRAHGVDGALAASRAAYVGGCVGTSNVLAGKLFGIPVKGTHAHSWVMCFEDEPSAFEAYAEAMPNNCVFLVDTYDTLRGVRNAVEAAKRLRARGHEMIGIRLDSGDLARLSIEARRILDEGGFPEAAIIASNDLDELTIEGLKRHGATITVWGVGTRLVTGGDQSALGGVYKLTAIRSCGGQWQARIKLSEEPIKVSNPGILQVRRFREGNAFECDVIYDQEFGLPDEAVMVDLADPERRRAVPSGAAADLLTPVFREGERVCSLPSVHDARRTAQEQLACLREEVKRFAEASPYPVGLELNLHERKSRLMREAREERNG